MLKSLKKEIASVRDRDPSAHSDWEVLSLYPGIHAVLLHRPAHWLYQKKHYYSARAISQLGRFLTGIEIHPGAKLGKGILIDHGSGVVIGETAEVGDNCTLYQGVTLGGTGKDRGKRHPTLGKNVTVGCGAKVLGPFSIGDGAKIASNAVVLRPIPAGATAVGVPARIVRINGDKVSCPLDHVHMPDPVRKEMRKIHKTMTHMQKRLDELEKPATPEELVVKEISSPKPNRNRNNNASKKKKKEETHETV